MLLAAIIDNFAHDSSGFGDHFACLAGIDPGYRDLALAAVVAGVDGESQVDVTLGKGPGAASPPDGLLRVAMIVYQGNLAVLVTSPDGDGRLDCQILYGQDQRGIARAKWCQAIEVIDQVDGQLLKVNVASDWQILDDWRFFQHSLNSSGQASPEAEKVLAG
jgi:hypothetical protein